MRRLSALRWLCATGFAALAVAPAAAAAAEPAPQLGIVMPDTLLTPGSPGTITGAYIVADRSVFLSNVKVTYNLADVAGFVDITAGDPAVCGRAGDTVTCTFPELAVDDWYLGLSHLGLVPKADAAVGDEGVVKVTISADGATGASDTATVAIGEGVDLAAEKASNGSAPPGGISIHALGVQNVGSVAAHGAVLIVDTDAPIHATPIFDNCLYDSGRLRACEFPTELAVDHSYGLTMPFDVRSDAIAPSIAVAVFRWATPAEWAALRTQLEKMGEPVGRPGSGKTLALTEKPKADLERADAKQVDVDATNNSTESTITVTGQNPADVAAVGAHASGAVGGAVDVKIGVTNKGPAAITPTRTYDGYASVRFTKPAGTTVISAPAGCVKITSDWEWAWDHEGEPGGDRYLCFPGYELAPGQSVLFAFRLRIDTGALTPGKVELHSVYQEHTPLPAVYDADPRNNIAEVTVTVSGDDNLPVTGTPVVMVVTAGAIVAALGFLLVRLARRRRLTEI